MITKIVKKVQAQHNVVHRYPRVVVGGEVDLSGPAGFWVHTHRNVPISYWAYGKT
jgi:hypothetical protein